MRTYVIVSATVFGVMGVVQITRIALAWSVNVAGFNVPIWMSAGALFVLVYMAGWGARLARGSKAASPTT